jgi:chromobox protein 1
VEKILNHLVDDEEGTIKYEVKWAGFEKKSDRTWEPEENLSASYPYIPSLG